MKISTQEYGDITVIELAGEFKNDYCNSFKQAIINTNESFQGGVVVDMSDVTFIDSIGIGQLLWANDHCEKHGNKFSLAGLDKNCEKILEVAGLEEVFDRHAVLNR